MTIMTIFKDIFVLFLMIFSGQASQGEAHKAGRSFASSHTEVVIGAAKSTNPHTVPGFVTDKPKEASLDAHSLGDDALSEVSKNEVAQHLTTQSQDRQSFKFDPDTDLLFRDADQIVANPQKSLKDEFIETQGISDIVEETKTCEESGDEYTQNCSKQLEIVLKITPETRKDVRYCPGHEKKKRVRLHYKHWTEHCSNGCITRVDITPKKVEIVSEEWVDGCAVLEDHVESGLCRYVSAFQSPKDETRPIQGEAITRDHFEEHYQYACFKTSPKTCGPLREKGCYQINSICKEKMGDHCILWEQTYRCESRKQSLKSLASTNKDNPFCLTGNCTDPSYEANDEMMTVMSQMSVLRASQNDLRDYKVIFKGQLRWCTRNCLNFRDCCGSNKGWGVSTGLSKCDKTEEELRELRNKNRCVMVGTYCAEREKISKICIRKKTTFCCFGTKMARLIQQSGRAQLGKGWGSSETPDCNGLSADELSRMDFSKIDFSELFAEIRNQMVSKNQEQTLAKVSTQRLQDNMALMTKPAMDPTSPQKLQEMKKKGL